MDEDVNQLDEVTVQAEKPLYQQEMDRMVVNVQSSVLTKGSSVLDVLERSPGVVIDRRNNTIVLNGKNGVGVMINGKLVRLPPAEIANMLTGMSANNIEKIEILHTPSSKYDAEGVAGMINIVVNKSEEQGTNGSFSLTGGYGLREKAVVSTNINHRSGRFNIYGNYSFTYDKTYFGMTAKGAFQFPFHQEERAFDFLHEKMPVRSMHNATIGFDSKINAKTIVGASSIISDNVYESKGYTLNKITIGGDSILLLKVDMDERNRWTSAINNINLERTLSKDEKISVDVDYLYYKNSNPSYFKNYFLNAKGEDAVSPEPRSFPEQSVTNETPVHIFVYKADYEKRFTPAIRMEAGIKASDSKIVNSIELRNLENGEWRSSNDPNTANRMIMKETIKAAYSALDLYINRVTINVGLRYEFTNTNIEYSEYAKEAIHRRYGKFFPTVFIRKKISEENNFQLSYNKRISRPAYTDIASNVSFNDIYSMSLGNHTLRPVITQGVQARFQHKQYLFSVQASKDQNQFIHSQQTESPSDSITYIMPHNLKYQNNLIFQATLPIQVNAWWTIQNNVSAGWKQFETQHLANNFTELFFLYNVYSSHNFTLPMGFLLEASGYYHSMDRNGMYKQKPFMTLNVGVKKELKNNIGTVQLSVTDLLSTTHYRVSIDPQEAPYSLRSNIDVITNQENHLS